MPTWNPQLYLKYGQERTRPALNLVQRIELESPKNMVDLGCDPDNSTAVLHQRWPEAAVMGIDSSPDMIAAARENHPWGSGAFEQKLTVSPLRINLKQ